MLEVKSIKYNFIMNSILTASSFILPLITFPYVSRILHSDGIGRVSFVTSVISYFSMIAMLGIPTYGIRACAQVRDNKEELSRTVQEILLINMIMGVVAYIGLFLAVTFIDKLSNEQELFRVMGMMIFFNIIGVEWLYKGLEQYTYMTIRSVIFKIISIGILFLFVKSPDDYVIYGGVTMLANVSSNLLNFIHLKTYITLRPLGKYHFRRHMKAIGVFFSMSLAVTVYADLDVVMLGFLSNSTQVGYYNAAVKIKNVLLSIVASLGVVLLPRVSYYIEHQMFEDFKLAIKKSLNFTLLIATPLVFYFIIFAKEGILFLSGNTFSNAVLPMQILLPSVLLIGITNILGFQILVPIHREKVVLYSQCSGALTNLILNTTLIPIWAASGAAIGTLITELIVLLVQVWFLRDIILPFFDEIAYWKFLLAIFIASISVIAFKWIHIPVFFILSFSAIIFFSVYLFILYQCHEPWVYTLGQTLILKLKTSTSK